MIDRARLIHSSDWQSRCGSSATGIPRNAINKRNLRPVKLRQRLDWVRPRDRRDQGSEKDPRSKIEAEMPDECG
jgi:hypothetical protein